MARRTRLRKRRNKHHDETFHSSNHAALQTQKPVNNTPTTPQQQVLQLQRTIGNHQTQRVLRNVVQRFDVKTDTLTTKHRVKPLRKLAGGAQGSLYSFQVLDKTPVTLVVKFDLSPIEDSLLGSKVQQLGGVATPYMRKATEAERPAVVGKGRVVPKPLAYEKEADIYFMEHVPGNNLTKTIDNSSLKELETLLLSTSFWATIGQMHAADTMSGNWDRFKFAQRAVGKTIRLSSGTNLKNIMVDMENKSAIAIDNAMRNNPVDKSELGAFKTGKQADMRAEFKAIVGYIADQVAKRDEKKAGVFTSLATKIRSNGALVHAAVKAAHATFGKLTREGEGWKQKFDTKDMKHAGIGKDEYDLFKRRQRFVRLLASGMDVEAAKAIVDDDKAYKAWRLKYRREKLNDAWPGLDGSTSAKYVALPKRKFAHTLVWLRALHTKTGGTTLELGIPPKLIANRYNLLIVWSKFYLGRIDEDRAQRVIHNLAKSKPKERPKGFRKKKKKSSLFSWFKKK